MTCKTCEKYRKFIEAMSEEFAKYNQNKTAQYYKGQCDKILAATEKTDAIHNNVPE